MKYLGHDTNSRNDIRLRKLIQRHGSRGYGVYWVVNEIIAEKVETHKLDCILEYSIDDLSAELNEKPDIIRTVLDYAVEIGLLSKAGQNYQNLKILKRLDEYTKKRIRTQSVQYPDSSRTVSPEKKEKNEMKTKEKKFDSKAFYKAKKLDRRTDEEKAYDKLHPSGLGPLALNAIAKSNDLKKFLRGKTVDELKAEIEKPIDSTLNTPANDTQDEF